MTKTNKSSPERSYGILNRSHTYMIVFMYCTERRKHYMYHNCAEPLISCSNEREWFELMTVHNATTSVIKNTVLSSIIIGHRKNKSNDEWEGVFLSRLFLLYCFFFVCFLISKTLHCKQLRFYLIPRR